jgi:phosphate-selective porin OprO/OprP
MIVRIIFMLAVAMVWSQVMPGMVKTSAAGSKALEQLLEILEKKGDISNHEADSVRNAITEEEQALLERKEELEAKERDLLERERALRVRETAVSTGGLADKEKEGAIGEGVKAPSKTTGKNVAARDQQIQTSVPLETWYKDGFCLGAPDEEMYSLCIGGLLQADYRYFKYDNEDPDRNGFDLRRVRMLLKGSMLRHFDYKFEYEFEGAGGRRLLDAYVDANFLTDASFRVGQFKTPYGFEWLTKDKNLVFAERSMGVFLTPGRSLGDGPRIAVEGRNELRRWSV